MTSDALELEPEHGLPLGWMRVSFASAGQRRVSGLMSARAGGISLPPYDACNLGDHVKDAPDAVASNRAVFAQALGATPLWLTQVHGNRLVRLSRDASRPTSLALPGRMADIPFLNPDIDTTQPEADGAITTEPGLACTVMVADCLPVLLAAPEGRGVAALHAGWRGLAGAGAMNGRGILHAGVQALCDATGADPADLHAWRGPCIGPAMFEVGADVLMGFGVDPAHASGHPRFKEFQPPGLAAGVDAAPSTSQATGKWLADLAGLARDTLQSLGVRHIDGGQWCTVSDRSRFFSFRRDGITGRQAAGICIR